MRFGVLYEIHTPRPWHENSDFDRYWEAIDEVKLAESVGFDNVWAVEHHFTEEFAHCSSPEIFLTAVAQHTTTIRIGHGVVLLPKNYNHALRVAERGAALDILSKGRLDLGTGRSATVLELKAFQIDPEDTRPQWEEAIQILGKYWTQERVNFEGKYYQIPKRTVLPHPYQKPHPPLWMAGGQKTSVELAAKYGLGFLHFALIDPDEAPEYLEHYRRNIVNAEPPGGFVNNQFASFTLGFCGEDEDEVLQVGGPGALHYATERYRVQGAWERAYGEVPPSYQRYEDQKHDVVDLQTEDGLDKLMKLRTMAVGTAEQCRTIVETYDRIGVDQLILYMELPFLSHEQIKKSIRMFGERVIQPYKAERRQEAASAG